MLKEFGLTPREWGDLEPHEKLYLEQASQEYNRQRNEEIKNAT